MDKNTLIRFSLLLLALVNQSLTMFGYPLLPFDEQVVTDIVTIIFTIVTALWAWWKNNNITPAAKLVQKILNAIKNGNISEDELLKLVK